MRRNIRAAVSPLRFATWIRRGYPRSAPRSGHCYLMALHGVDSASR